ncbi:MAG TPA: DUF423 domain-containing protein [Thermoanaerobaculales bacterium]|nr:DUF423 domain-containing protein [Thermoanaerobaculales bacterium]HPA79186.1 DUF423 domain-containing protein [Thermoanaerobaculales bacterium]HQL29145.1 DUF423 domain-containing protein [Thermoanaerobaculales bacterium]HQN95067.1 DUF423 domain-containing protein [Thermoanaerobaculales bacterium]HQP42224.1 DUF423 domain-containing protein [Thermoanaerobaculales bacterium]
MTPRIATVLGALLAGTAVAAGAFAAHGLRGRLDPESVAIFETAARYQIYHGVALVVAALASERWPGAKLSLVWWLFLAGTVVFSGSLYLLALTGLRALGAFTPIGGGLLIAGWATFAWRVARS